MSDVINDLMGMLIGLGPVVVALLWCDLSDRFRHRANRVGAEIRATTNRALGGESMLAVRVQPAMVWRPGRVHLSTPGGYEFLIASVSGAVINRLPHNYELVVHRGGAGRASEQETSMAKRILMVITPRTTGDARRAAHRAALVARESGGQVRVVFVRPIPPARMDHHDRLVAGPDAEMARLAGLAESCMAALVPEFGDVAVESRIRFGQLAAELRIEAESFGADLIGLAAPARPGPRHRLRAWYLGATLPAPVVLLALAPDDAADRRRESAVLPAFR